MSFLRSPLHTLLVGAAASALGSGISTAQSSRQSISGNEVAIYNLAGRVRVESGSGSEVTVEVTRGGRDAKTLQLATSEIRGRNTFRVLYPDDDIVYLGSSDSRRRYSTEIQVNRDGTWGGEGRSVWRGGRTRVSTSGRGTEAWADLLVRVPAGKTVAVYLAVGEMSADRVDADLRLDVASARVTANGTRGALTIDAGSGSVEVRDASGAVLNVDTGSGSVTLDRVRSEQCSIDTGSGGVRGDGVQCGMLRVDVGSGSVSLAALRSSDAGIESGSGSITLGFDTSPRAVSVETGSGSVTMSLPSDVGAQLDIETGSGGISSDYPVRTTTMRRNTLRGSIGDGSGRIRIETGSGSVRLRRSLD